MATMDDVEIQVSLKDNISSGMGKIKNSFSGLKAAGSGALNSLANSFSMVDSVAMSALGSATGKTANEYILGTSKIAETNKVLIKGMGDTEAQAASMYNTIDEVTNNHLTSMQNLIPAMNAFKSATGASGATMEANADKIASFGDNVLALTGSEERAETAMMDLSKGIKGAYAALDQYGISEDALMRTGLWSGKEDDIEGYLAAVEEVAGANDEMMNTMQGVEAKIGKAFSRSGKQLGEGMLPGIKELANGFLSLDEASGGWLTKGILIGTEAISVGAQVGGALGQISQGYNAAKDAVSAGKEAWDTFWDKLEKGKDVCDDVKEGLGDLKDVVDDTKGGGSKGGDVDLPSGKDKTKAPEVSFDTEIDAPKSKKNKYKDVEKALDEEKKGLQKVNSKVSDVAKESDTLSKTTKNADKMSKGGKNLDKMGKAIPAGTGAKITTAGAEASSTAGGLSAFSSGVMSMLVPLLQVAVVIAVMIPVAAALVAEALLFAKAIGELIKALDFKSMNLSAQIDGIKQIGSAVFELGVVMGAMTFTSVITLVYNAVRSLSLLNDPVKQAVNEIKRLAPLLSSLNNINIPQGVGDKLKSVSETLKSLGTAFSSLSNVVGGVILGNVMMLGGLLGSFTSNLKVAKNEITNAANIIGEMQNTPDIPEGVAEKLKKTGESLKAVADAMSALTDTNWDINMGNLTNLGGLLGNMQSHLRDAKEEIIASVPILNEFSSMPTINDGVGDKLKKTSEALKSAADAIKSLSTVQEKLGGNPLENILKISELTLALKSAKSVLFDAANEMSNLNSLPDIPDTVKTKVNKIGSTVATVINCLKPLTTISKNEDINSGTIVSKVQQARYAISNSATHLASLAGIPSIPDDMKTKISKVGTSAATVMNTLKPLSQLTAQDIKSSTISSRIAQARYAISNSAIHLASLNGIPNVGEGLGEKLNSVGTAAKKVSTISTTLQAMPAVGEGASLKVHNAVSAVKKMITELQGLAGAKTGNVSGVLSSVRTAMRQVNTIVRSSAGTARTSGVSVGQAIKNGIRSGMNGLGSAITPIVRSAMNQAKSTAVSGARSAGTEAVNGFKYTFKIANVVNTEMNYAIQNMRTKGAELAQAAGEAASNATSEFESNMEVGSPGKIARITKQEMIYTLGFVKQYSPYLTRAVGAVAKGMVNAFGNPQLTMDLGLNNNINPNDLQAYQSIASQKVPTSSVGGMQQIIFNFLEGSMQLDARNLTTKESKQILINALEGLDQIKNINIKGMG